MGGETLFCQTFVFGTWTTIIGVGPNADASTWSEDACHLDIFWVHQPDEVFHDGVDTVLMEVAMIAEAEEIEFEALALDHPLIRNITDTYFSEVGLASDRT